MMTASSLWSMAVWDFFGIWILDLGISNPGLPSLNFELLVSALNLKLCSVPASICTKEK